MERSEDESNVARCSHHVRTYRTLFINIFNYHLSLFQMHE
jgi:hypothetical protein